MTVLSSLVGSDDQTRGGIRHALAAVRKHLGMEVAYISAFVGARSVFREVDAPGLEALIRPVSRNRSTTSIAAIGAHMSVPVLLADGSAYGMFCCLSPHPNRSLNNRDLQVMRVFADLAGHQIDRDLVAERASSLFKRVSHASG
jgi:hypothetical protein